MTTSQEPSAVADDGEAGPAGASRDGLEDWLTGLREKMDNDPVDWMTLDDQNLSAPAIPVEPAEQPGQQVVGRHRAAE